MTSSIYNNIVQPLVNTASYSLLLDPIDDHENSDSFLMPTTAVKGETSLLLKVSLPYRRLWNCTVLAHACEEHVVVNATELSKKLLQSR